MCSVDIYFPTNNGDGDGLASANYSYCALSNFASSLSPTSQICETFLTDSNWTTDASNLATLNSIYGSSGFPSSTPYFVYSGTIQTQFSGAQYDVILGANTVCVQTGCSLSSYPSLPSGGACVDTTLNALVSQGHCAECIRAAASSVSNPICCTGCDGFTAPQTVSCTSANNPGLISDGQLYCTCNSNTDCGSNNSCVSGKCLGATNYAFLTSTSYNYPINQAAADSYCATSQKGLDFTHNLGAAKLIYHGLVVTDPSTTLYDIAARYLTSGPVFDAVTRAPLSGGLPQIITTESNTPSTCTSGTKMLDCLFQSIGTPGQLFWSGVPIGPISNGVPTTLSNSFFQTCSTSGFGSCNYGNAGIVGQTGMSGSWGNQSWGAYGNTLPIICIANGGATELVMQKQ